MAMVRTPRKRSAARREEVAEAVLNLVGSRGPGALTTTEIARVVGLTSGALFRHFDSREAMLDAAVELAVARIEATFPGSAAPPRDRILALARGRLELLGREPGIAWFLRSPQATELLSEAAAEKLQGIKRRSRAFLQEAILEGAAAGTIRDDVEAPVLLLVLTSTIHALLPGGGSRELDTDQVLRGLRRLLSPANAIRSRRPPTSKEPVMTLDPSQTVAQIATEHPASTRVFGRHQIDFCCGGQRSLTEACAKARVDLEAVQLELDQALQERDSDLQRWDTEPIPQLIDYILRVYHRPFDEEFPRLHALATKVARVHGDKPAGAKLEEIEAVYTNLMNELVPHFEKEEQILFPMILRGQGAMAVGPIHVMRMEHESAGEALRRLRTLTGDYQVPEEACGSWRALWNGLEDLERSLHEHIHLENNVLFPRVLEEG